MNPKPILFYPVSPIKIIEAFGADPAYYAKFLDQNGNPEKGRMGIDLQAAHGQSPIGSASVTARAAGKRVAAFLSSTRIGRKRIARLPEATAPIPGAASARFAARGSSTFMSTISKSE
jgi:hypothetical protein